MSIERVVCLNCMDGRVQLPVIDWIKKNYSVHFVDMVTEPGMDGIISSERSSLENVVEKTKLSIYANDAQMIFVVGHHDCKGNPVDDQTHKKHIELSVQKLKAHNFSIPIVGLWVTSDWEVEEIKTIEASV